ncbi:LGFP repeat-containing protein, partial [Arthrobacter sp. ok362]|uniref:LGFP repeat-containing protein n=1 Tax=Arthrobacter sp. ok362 TaxID=1761745 RepID=UPI0015880839
MLAIALGIPLAGSIAFDGLPAVAAACTSGTSAPADPYPGTTAAATNFESGALSPFIPFTAVTGTASVSSAFSHSPGCSAYLHATQDNGSIANMSLGLASGMKEAYADGWFNIAKEGVAGNNVPYFRFFSGGIRYVDVFRDNATHELVLRTTGAQAFVYNTLVPTVALGTWHHLVMHVVPKGAATGVQIWWDDKSVFAQTVNISATRFDKVQLGAEHDQQMGDIYVDDVIVNSGTETPGPVPGTLPGGGGGGGGGTVPPAATTEIKAAAAAKPALGTSTSAIICGLVKGGCYQRFQAGAIHYAPGVGAFATWGGIRTAWKAVGTEKGKLGYP